MSTFQINDRIQAGANELISNSARFRDEYLGYELDYSWPSVGLLDLYAQPLKGKNSLEGKDRHLILCISSYLGIFAANCWKSFDPQLSIAVELSESHDVLLAATGGSTLEGKEFLVNISNSLQILLLDHSSALGKGFQIVPFFENGEIEINRQTNIFSLFAYGLLSGLCPWGEGHWAEISCGDFKKEMVVVNHILSESTASYYKNLFPVEAIGSNPALFQKGLIFLPGGFLEEDIYSRALTSICNHLQELGVSNKKKFGLALNLARLPDQTIASAGFALCTCLYKYASRQEIEILKLLSSHFRKGAPTLSPLLNLGRKKLSEEDSDFSESSWPELIKRGMQEDAEKLYSLERELGFLPLLRLKKETILNASPNLLEAIRLSSSRDVQDEISLMFSTGKVPADIVLLDLFIDYWRGQTPQAEEKIKTFSQSDFSEDEFSLANFLEIKARLKFLKKEYQSGLDYLKSSLKLNPMERSNSDSASLSIERFPIFRMLGQLKESSACVEESLKYDSLNFLARGRKLLQAIEESIKEDDEITEFEKELLYLHRANPHHPMIFSACKLYSYIDSTANDLNEKLKKE